MFLYMELVPKICPQLSVTPCTRILRVIHIENNTDYRFSLWLIINLISSLWLLPHDVIIQE
jgi:hypothetical protein